jgi:hypothetical protein
MSSKIFAQQMIPKQIGVEFTYSVFPKSPKAKLYVKYGACFLLEEW